MDFTFVHIHDTILSTKSFLWLDGCREALFWNTGFCILQNQGLQKSFPWITYIESKKSILKEVMDLRGKMVFLYGFLKYSQIAPWLIVLCIWYAEYEPFWQEVSLWSLKLRWPLRPVVLLFTPIKFSHILIKILEKYICTRIIFHGV